MAGEGFFAKLPDETVYNILEYLDLESLCALDSLEVRFSSLIPGLHLKIIDLRKKRASMPKTVKFLIDAKVPVKELHLPDCKYSDYDIDCIEKIIVHNADRLQKFTLPPLKIKAQEARLVAAITHCTNLKSLNVRRNIENNRKQNKGERNNGLDNALRNIIIRNKNNLVHLRLCNLDGLTDIPKLFKAARLCTGLEKFKTDAKYSEILHTCGFQTMIWVSKWSKRGELRWSGVRTSTVNNQ